MTQRWICFTWEVKYTKTGTWSMKVFLFMSLNLRSIRHSNISSFFFVLCIRCGGAAAKPSQRGAQPAGEMRFLKDSFRHWSSLIGSKTSRWWCLISQPISYQRIFREWGSVNNYKTNDRGLMMTDVRFVEFSTKQMQIHNGRSEFWHKDLPHM